MRRIIGLGASIAALLLLPAAPAAASDKSVSKQLVITAADAPSGFAASKGSVSPSTLPQIAECVGKPVDGRVITSRVAGPDLTSTSDGRSITSSVVFVKTAAMARADAAVLADPKFPDCLAQVTQTALAGQGVTNVTAQPVSLKPYGATSTAVAVHITGTSNGQPVSIVAVEVGILKGRAEINAAFVTDGNRPFDQTQGEATLTKLNRRLAKAKVG